MDERVEHFERRAGKGAPNGEAFTLEAAGAVVTRATGRSRALEQAREAEEA